MSKISELSDGGVIQGGDTLIAVRSGGNVKVTYGGSTTANIDGGTIDGTVIGGSTAAAITGTTITGTSFVSSGDMTFGDNDKAIFGAGSDLQIYHDGSNSFISDVGTGNLGIRAENLFLQNADGSENYATATVNGAFTLSYDNSAKLATTATGIDVTGTVTADGLTVDGTAIIQKATGATLTVTNTGNDIATIVLGNTGSHNTFLTQENGVFTIEDPSIGSRLSIADNGDLSLYEDTGTTAKLLWDASQQLLLIGEDASNRIGTGANLALGDSDGGLLSIGSTKANDFNAGDIMGSIEFRNVDGSIAEKTKAKIVAVDDTSTGASAYPLGVALAFSTISAGTLAEAMRLTSAGHLQLSDSTDNIIRSGSDSSRIRIFGGGTDSVSNGSALTLQGVTHSGGNYADLASGAGGYINFRIGTSNAARIDSSGNLGLGVTPSAWSAPAFQISRGSHFADTGSVSMQHNAYFNSGWKYIASSQGALQFQAIPGTGFLWNTATSGTAGNAISFSERMRITSAGNVGIGESNPQELLHLTATTPVFRMQGGSRTYQQFVSGTDFVIRDVTATANRITLDSSGNLLVGSPTAFLSGSTRLQVYNDTAPAAELSTGNSATTDVLGTWNRAASGDNQFISFYTEASATRRGSITYNRGAGLVAYNTTSDYRAKDISGPVTDSGALIDATPVYMGKMKGATQERPMFIAHEVPAYAHTGEKDAVDADGNPIYQQMDVSALVPVMWAEIQSLRARVAQLEGAN